MEINSNSRYLNALEDQALLQASQARQSNTNTDSTSDTDTAENQDYFESTLTDNTSALKSETYNDIMELIKANKQASGTTEPEAPTEEDFKEALEELLDSFTNVTSTTDTDSTTNADSITDTGTVTTTDATTATETTTETSTSGSSTSDSDTEDSTTTETVVMPDGSIFLKTTSTTEDGTETVTMTKIADGTRPMQKPNDPPAALVSDAQTENSDSTATDQDNILKMNFAGGIPPMMPPYDEALTISEDAAEADDTIETA